MSERISVFRKEHFNAAHRLFNPAWDDAKNFDVFGKCSNPHFHGHNYELIVKLTGEINPVTGFLMDLKELSDLIQVNVLEKFDHRNLNEDCPEFKGINPTAENIAVVIFKKLRPLIKEEIEVQIKLYETERNFVEYPA
jgi:6-pyruvoyltetrahydropterin/6-carboxytetrahydropterin synthase